MANWRTIGDLLHSGTHRVPGVPEHREHDRGHQGRAHTGADHGPTLNERLNHRPTNRGEPRVLVGWQQRIARLAGRK